MQVQGAKKQRSYRRNGNGAPSTGDSTMTRLTEPVPRPGDLPPNGIPNHEPLPGTMPGEDPLPDMDPEPQPDLDPERLPGHEPGEPSRPNPNDPGRV